MKHVFLSESQVYHINPPKVFGFILTDDVAEEYELGYTASEYVRTSRQVFLYFSKIIRPLKARYPDLLTDDIREQFNYVWYKK